MPRIILNRQSSVLVATLALCSSMALIAIALASTSQVVAQDLSDVDDPEDVQLARLAIDVASQQIMISKIEFDQLTLAHRISKHKVKEAAANLALETVKCNNTDSMFEQKLTSPKDKELQDEKKKVAETALLIAEANSGIALKSIELKQAQIRLFELQKLMADIRFKQLEGANVE